MGAGVVLADVFAEDATTGLALPFVFRGSEQPHLKSRVIMGKSGNQIGVYAVIVLYAVS